MTSRHVPVMTAEVLHYLVHDATRVVIDATLGGGGHAAAILSKHESLTLVGMDRDPAALELATKRLSSFGRRFTPVHAVFADLARAVEDVGPVDGILADLGVSSMQLDDAVRGFSHRADGPLDMRMDTVGETAAELIARSDRDSISDVLRYFGEVRRPRSLASAIKCASDDGDMQTTGDLRRVVTKTLGGAVSAALLSRVFQSFRIAVNGEIDQLVSFLGASLEALKPGGRIVVISYHSLEDRAVKNFFRAESSECLCPPGLPVCVCGRTPRVEVLTRRVVKPSDEEVNTNARARSARLRAAKATSNGGGR